VECLAAQQGEHFARFLGETHGCLEKSHVGIEIVAGSTACTLLVFVERHAQFWLRVRTKPTGTPLADSTAVDTGDGKARTYVCKRSASKRTP